MNEQDPEGPKRNITWQIQLPRPCEHQYEVVAQQDGDEIRQCAKCGNLEAE